MARIRTLKPDFWRHEALCELPEATHMLAAALLNYADDYGYFNANPKLIEGEIYPLRKPSVKIPESLRRLQEVGYIELGTSPDGRRYGRIVHFAEHQKVSHPTDSKISCLSISWDNSGNSPENIANPPESLRPERKGKEGKGNIYSFDFEKFWFAYPKKEAKADAFRAFQKALEKTDAQTLIAAAGAFAIKRVGQDKTYTKLPATWLNKECWLDDGLAGGAAALTPEQIADNERRREALYGPRKVSDAIQ